MTAAAPMQWKTIRLSIIAVGVRRSLGLLRRLLDGLTAGDERGQAFHLVIRLRCVLRTRLEVLGLLLRLELLGLGLRLRLKLLGLRLLLLALIERLRFARREWLAADRLLVVSVVERVVGRIAAVLALLLRIIGRGLAESFLGGGDQTEIMFGVLIIVFGGNRIAGTLRVAG